MGVAGLVGSGGKFLERISATWRAWGFTRGLRGGAAPDLHLDNHSNVRKEKI